MTVIERLRYMLIGAAGMAILTAAAAYVNPPLRCLNEPGSAWLGAPVNHCYRLTDVFPESAFSPAR